MLNTAISLKANKGGAQDRFLLFLLNAGPIDDLLNVLITESRYNINYTATNQIANQHCEETKQAKYKINEQKRLCIVNDSTYVRT